MHSYITLDFADDYHRTRGNTQWQALNETEKTQRLCQASDYLDVAYRFKGKPATATQCRAFPRAGQDSVPQKVCFAVCELALQPDLTANAAPIKSAVKVGDLSVTYQQPRVANSVENQRFPYVAALLSEFCATENQIAFIPITRS